MGGSVGTIGDFALVADFVQDATFYARRLTGGNREERRKQVFECRLRKLRLRERRERKQRGRVSARYVPQVTEFGQSIARLRAPVRPQEAISDYYWGFINLKWRFEAFRGDPGMQALLAEVKSEGNIPDEGAGLFVQEFQRLTDGLDARIHRLFRPSNFQNPLLKVRLPEARQHQVWVRMRPALTLATKLLLDLRLGAFWYHLMYGIPVTDRATRKTYLMHCDREDDLETARADFAALLESLADRISFYWRPAKLHGKGITGVHSCSFWELLEEFLDVSRWEHLRKPAEGYNGYVGLSCNFLYHLASRHAVTRTSLEADMRMQFLLAVTIAHELAHAIYAWRGLPFTAWNGFSEHFAFDTDLSNEVGWSWENHLFDGVILSCEITHDALGTFMARTWESMVLEQTFIWTDVPDDWLRSLFLKDTWKNINRTIPQLPRPVGRPRVFWAQRYIDDQRGFEAVQYTNGLATSPGHELLNASEGPIRGCVDKWFKAVRKNDMRKAVRTGEFVAVTHRGPRDEVLGKGIICAPTDGEDGSMGDVEMDDGDDGGRSDGSSDDGFKDGEDPPEAWGREFWVLTDMDF